MFKDKNIAYISIFGVLVRALIFLVFYTHVTIFADSSGYIDLSNHLLNFDLTGYDGMRSPGYAILIALAFKNLYVSVFYQFLLGIFTAILWYLMLNKVWFSKKESFYITLFLQTFLNIYFFETAILMESFVLFLLSLIFYLVSLKEMNFKRELLLGFVLGYLVFTKSFYMYLPCLIFVFWLFKYPKNSKQISRRLIIFVFPILAYFSWSYVNKVQHGYFSSTTLMGVYLAQNCVRFAEHAPEEFNWLSEPYVTYREKAKAENDDIAMSIWDAYNSGAYDTYNLDFPDFSHELVSFAKQTIKENPIDYLKQVVFYSWSDFWKPTIYWNYTDFNFKYANKLFHGIWLIQLAILWLFRILFLILIPYYLIKNLKNKTIDFRFFIITVILTTSILQALLTYGTNSRFSYPFEFLMLIVVILFFKDKNWWFLKPVVNKVKYYLR